MRTLARLIVDLLLARAIVFWSTISLAKTGKYLPYDAFSVACSESQKREAYSVRFARKVQLSAFELRKRLKKY